MDNSWQNFRQCQRKIGLNKKTRQEYNIPRDDLTADTERLLQRICQLRRRYLNSTPVYLVCPTSIILEDIVRLIKVDCQGFIVGLIQYEPRHHA